MGFENEIEKRLYVRPSAGNQPKNEEEDPMVKNVYQRFFGRIQVIESEKDVKMLPGGTVYARPFVEKALKVTDLREECWQAVFIKVRKML